MNYNSLMNKPTINYRELIGDNTVTEVGGITEEQFNTLLNTDLSSYYTKAQIDDLFSRSYVYREKSGSIVTFDCPASVNAIHVVLSEIVAIQDLHGYDNPWPAGGGKNKFNCTATTQTKNQVTFTINDDGTVSLSGTASAIASVVIGTVTLSAGTYILSGGVSDEIYLNIQNPVYYSKASETQFTVESETTFTMFATVVQGVNVTGKVFKPMIRLASVTDATFAPYSNICPISGFTEANVVVSPTTDAEDGTTYTTTLKDGQGNPLTCYGGTLSNENGVQSLDNGKDIRLVSECTWQGSNGAFYTSSVVSSIKHGDGRFDHVISSAYKTENVGSITPLSDGAISVDADGYIQIKDSRYSTAGDFKSNMGTTQLVYELATPQQIPQDSLSIAAQEGTNNLWADSGNITVKALDKIIQG